MTSAKRRWATISRTRDAICDTSPIQYLHQIGLLELLPEFYSRVIVPPTVLIELGRGSEIGIDLPNVHKLPWLTSHAPESLGSVATAAELGTGEKEVLALGLQLHSSVVVLDDRLARRYATALGLPVTGTLGIVLRAKADGRLSKVEPVIEKLNSLGFRLSPKTRAAVLKPPNEEQARCARNPRCPQLTNRARAEDLEAMTNAKPGGGMLSWRRQGWGGRVFRLLAAAAALAGAGGESRAAAPQVTYHKHIAPILYEYCAGCHRPGEPGPFSLLTYADAKKRAGLIADVTRRRYMPPWLPEPGHGDFAGERRLSDAQIETIRQWAAEGAPEGAAAEAPPAPKFTPGWQLGLPDLVLEVVKPFAVPADGPDLFWNFVLSPGITQTRYVKGIEIRPGNARSVHHANIAMDPARSSRRREKAPGEGFPGMDLSIERPTFDPDSHFLFWKPGTVPSVEADGMSWRLNPSNDLILNVHFHPTGKPELVAPSVGLYFTDKPPTKLPMLVQIERDSQLDIPAGTRDFAVADDFRTPVDMDVLAVYPHAHYLGSLLEGYATLPGGGRKWLIRIPQWDINWQAVYSYRQPVFLPRGTVISMRYHYDNSAANPRNPNSPPKRVTSGDQSTDEMGHLWLQVLPRGGEDQRPALLEALMRHRMENDPANASAHFNLGMLLLRRADTPGAIDQLRDALRLEPRQPMAWNNLGAALQTEGRLDEALEQFRHALQIAPDFTNARFNLANGLAAQGKLDEAAADFREVLAAEPGDAAARTQLIAVLLRAGNEDVAQGRLSAATGRYRELVALRPEDADMHNNFGILLAQAGDLAGAAAQFEAALKINPGHATARKNLEAIRSRPGQGK